MTYEEGFVGLDVGKFEIFVFISKTEMAFSVSNTPAGHAKLQNKIGQPNGQVIALEPTGGYEWAAWETLDSAGYDVRQISAAHVRAFARATGALAKTDPIDARMIAKFMAFRPDCGRKLPAEKLRLLNALSSKRRQLVELRKRVKCQSKQQHNLSLMELDEELLCVLSSQIKALDVEIQVQIKADVQMSQHSKILRSIPGIGPVLCSALIGEMPELGTISDKR